MFRLLWIGFSITVEWFQLTILVTYINKFICGRVLSHSWFTPGLYPIHSTHCSNYKLNDCILPSWVSLLMVMADPRVPTTDLLVNCNLRSAMGNDSGRDWRDGVTSQGMLTQARIWKLQVTEPSLKPLMKCALTSWFQVSRLQDCERINFSSFFIIVIRN